MKFDTSRPVSWSMISSFEYDKEQWYRRYVLGLKSEDTQEMLFGKKMADSIENGTPLAPVTVLDKVEHKFEVVFCKIKLVGYADTFAKDCKGLGEYKTGKKPWDQKRVDEHRQIDMYLLMNLITNKVKPEDVECFLEWIPTQEMGDFTIDFVKPVKVRKFSTKRTTAQVLKFGSYIQKVHKEMQEYAENHPVDNPLEKSPHVR